GIPHGERHTRHADRAQCEGDGDAHLRTVCGTLGPHVRQSWPHVGCRTWCRTGCENCRTANPSNCRTHPVPPFGFCVTEPGCDTFGGHAGRCVGAVLWLKKSSDSQPPSLR